MLKRLWLFTSCILLWLGGVHAQASWAVRLYAPTDGRLLKVDSDGLILEDDRLPLLTGYSFYPFDVTFSPDGTYVAYVLSASDRPDQLIVYDTRQNSIIYHQNITQIGSEIITASRRLFSEDGRTLAIGYLTEGGWEIAIIDLTAERITLIFRSGLLAQNLPDVDTAAPIVQAYRDGQVYFTLVTASENGQIIPIGGYVWNTRSNTISPTQAYTTLHADTFWPADEVVQAEYLRQWPAANQQPNVLTVYIPTIDQRIPIYHAAGGTVLFARFIAHGENILASTINASGLPEWRIISRDGRASQWQTAHRGIISSIMGTADGFLYTADVIQSDGNSYTTLYHVTDNDEILLWQSDNGQTLRLVWLGDGQLSATEHDTWAILDDIVIANPTVTPTATPTSNEWQAWLYQSDGSLQLIRQGQTLETLQLPLSDGEDYPLQIAISYDGRLAAYVAYRQGRPSALQVYDLAEQRLITRYALPHDDSAYIPSQSMERISDGRIFAEFNSAVAIGFGLGEVGWQVSVIDLESGEVSHTLRYDDEVMARYEPRSEFGVVPVIQHFRAGQIAFTLHNPGLLSPPYPAYIWDIRSGDVGITRDYQNPFSDILPTTGEVVYATTEPNLPYSQAFTRPQLNALYVYSPLLNASFPFHNWEANSHVSPMFIQNGERVLTGRVDETGAFDTWWVIERDGTEIAPLEQLSFQDAGMTADGFLYIPRASTSSLNIWHMNTREGGTREQVWQGERVGQAQIAWVGYAAPPPHYREWAQLLPPQTGVTIATSNTLQTGESATVNTTNGDVLLVRLGPGAGYSVATRLTQGTRVALLEGPQEQEGVMWWRIRTPSGVEGWVAAMADGIRNLLPASP